MTLFAALLGAWLSAAPPEHDEPAFVRAYLKPEGLCFESPVDLDWEAMARRELKAFPIENPPSEELLKHRSEMGDSTITFSAALPAALKRLHFYLIAETGPRPIVPERLRGSVRYRFKPPARPELDVFYGEVCLSAPKAVHDAGFVAASGVPLSWRKAPAALVRSGRVTLVRLPNGTSPLPAPGFNKDAAGVRTAYVLSSPGVATRYLFVRRVADSPESNCEHTYDVYRWEPGLPVIASNAYNCDI